MTIEQRHLDFQQEIEKILKLTPEHVASLAEYFKTCYENSSWLNARRKAAANASFHAVYQMTREYWTELEKFIPRGEELGSAKEIAMSAFCGIRAKELEINSQDEELILITDEELELLCKPWKEITYCL